MDKVLLLDELRESVFCEFANEYFLHNNFINIRMTQGQIEGLLTNLSLFTPIIDAPSIYQKNRPTLASHGHVGEFTIDKDGNVRSSTVMIKYVRNMMRHWEIDDNNGGDAINLLKIDMWYDGMSRADNLIKSHLEEFVRKISHRCRKYLY